ncbi:SurA N-terminal domain-containing protein [Curvibacter sp. RS43]|uniref:SurA N-terminal domain-containing protein n=1 Tax=Curvibacter microcysteis TaxID=3026419 RepID=UPI002362ACE7|nr:SurA N-terminal domain-containing protein [Curvibacter sp. RS43]MDD0809181.1 SurA N-terminal domain-containing protein [Curvibacter sp. RS43]
MFESIRKHSKIVMIVLFLLIIPSFVLFGIDGYNRAMEKGTAVAKVDGHDISQGDWDLAHKNEVERLRAQMPNIDAKRFESSEARYVTLERLVREKVLAAASASMHLVTSDQKLARALQENPTIASLRRPDGSLDVDRYRQLLGAQGMTPEMYEAGMRADLSTRQVLSGINGSVIAPAAQANVALGAFFERREIQVAQFRPSDFASRVNPSEAELDAYYKANTNRFQLPERATVEYVVLDMEAVKSGISVNEGDLKTYYEQNTARLAAKEERRASHILITAAKDAPAAEREKAKAKAQALLAEVRKAPNTFADVARKNSQDPGSAPKGGDLDFFARGAMVKPFEDAAFALNKGDISDVVESDFGYHIIKLADIKTPRQKSFEELRPELEADLKQQQAQRKFAEVADSFTNLVYEQADSLKPAAERLKLSVRTFKDLTRAGANNLPAVLANPKILEAIFSADSVSKKRNTEAVEVGPSQLVAARITDYTPARIQPLDEVKAKVRELLVADQAAALARKEGADKLALWKATPASANLAAAVVISRDETQKQAAPVVDAALRIRASALPAFVGVDLGSQGYAVVRVTKVVPRAGVDEARALQERGQYAQWWAAAETRAYYEFLADKFKAQIKTPKPAANSSEENSQIGG